MKTVARVARKYPAIRKRYRVYYPAVKQLASDVMYLKGLINSEPKYHRYSNSGNVDYNGVMLPLSSIPTGTDNVSRNGDRVLPRWLQIHMFHGLGPTTTVPNLVVRVILFKWYGNNANLTTTPFVSEVLTNSGTVFAPLGYLDEDVVGSKGDRTRRIEVLKSKLITFNDINNYSSTLKLNIDLNPNTKKIKEHLEFVDATTNPAISGNIYMLIVTDNATNTEYGYKMTSKLVFYDN